MDAGKRVVLRCPGYLPMRWDDRDDRLFLIILTSIWNVNKCLVCKVTEVPEQQGLVFLN